MRIGLTGSMAAGKSTVSGILSKLGFFIIDADKTAHEVLDLPEIIAALRQYFGFKIIDASGSIDRKALSRAAFAYKEATERLNAIVHPRVFERMLYDAEYAEFNWNMHIVFDVPLLFETGFEKHCDKLISVIADSELRYRRIMLRDGLSRAEAAVRLARQMPQEEKAARSDAVITNNGTNAELEYNVLAALHKLGLRPPFHRSDAKSHKP